MSFKKSKAVLTAIPKYVNINQIHEVVGLNGGEDSQSTRWDTKNSKVANAREQLTKSIKEYGFLTGIIGVKMPEDIELFGKIYLKDHYMILDESGRTRVLKHLVENGYVINPNTDEENKVPVLDVSHLIINEPNIEERLIETIWRALVKLNTGSLKFSDYDFISSGARTPFQDKKQENIWKYLESTMRKHYPVLTNNCILAGTIGSLTDKMINDRYIPYDIDNCSKYSDHIFNGLIKIRQRWDVSKTPAMFLQAFAKYALASAKRNGFSAGEYDIEGKPITELSKKGYHKIYFEWSNTDFGSDQHFSQFQYYFDMIIRGFCEIRPPKGGFTGAMGKAKREIKEYIYQIYDDKERGI